MSFLDDFKNFIEKAKRKFGISWQKLLDQIPDQDRLDSYRYDEILNRYVLKSTMIENEPYILDEYRRLKVETSNYKEFDGEKLAIDLVPSLYYEYELDFLADSVTIIIYDLSISNLTGYSLWYLIKDLDGNISPIEIVEDFDGIEADVMTQIDIKPFNKFQLRIIKHTDADYWKWKIIFSKQKKTKISDLIYNATNWNAITDIGASKNAIRDKIEAMITEYEALVSDIAYNESTWNAVTTIAPSKNAIRDWIEAHLVVDAHHDEDHTHEEEDIIDLGNYITEEEAVQGVEDAGLVLSSTKVITSADENLAFVFGRTGLGHPSYSDSGAFGHRDNMTVAGRYALLQNSAGSTILNARAGLTITFRINATTFITMSASALSMLIPIAMGTNKITGCGDPIDDQDVATKKWVTDNFVAQ